MARPDDEDPNEQAGKEAYSGVTLIERGNGAREAMAALFEEYAVEMGTGCACPQCSADRALAWLWNVGFKVVPITRQ